MSDAATATQQGPNPTLEWKSRAGRLTLTATILGSGLAFLDSSVVSVALPHIEKDLGGGISTLQWVFNSYLLTLGAFVLVGGSLGDLLGKRRVFIWGAWVFGAASLLCGIAPNTEALIGARMLQGLGAALIVPTSLAILNALFVGQDRGRAIGAWSGLAGLFTAFGPFVGGILVETGPSGWRWIFLLNLPLVVGAVIFAKAGIPNLVGTRTNAPIRRQVDFLGGILAVLGLGFIVGPLIEIERLGPALTAALVVVGVGFLTGFGFVEVRRQRTNDPPPMVRLSLFRIRTFRVANASTFVVYGALGGAFFLVTVALQQGLGYSAIAAGASGVPVTIVLALGSAKIGKLVPKVGARPFLVAGPLIMAVGMSLLALIEPGMTYWVLVFPGYVIFACGLVLVVAPVTTTALAEVGPDQSGAASGVNNAVARIASLAAIILLPLAGGMASSQKNGLATGEAFLAGYRISMFVAAGLCVLGAMIALFGFTRDDAKAPAPAATARPCTPEKG